MDSIALPFRYEFEDIPQRNRLLAALSQSLLSIAGLQNAAVTYFFALSITLKLLICMSWDAVSLISCLYFVFARYTLINLIILFWKNTAQVIVTNQITTKFITNEASATIHSALVPALGDSWGHICSVRLLLSKTDDLPSEQRRFARLLKHPGRPSGVATYQVTVYLLHV